MRDFFLRLRTIFISLLFMLLLTAFLVFPQRIADIATKMDQQDENVRTLLTVAALLANVVFLFIIYQELRPRRRNAQGLLVRSRGSSAEVSLESVSTNLNTQIGKISNIFDVDTRVRAIRGRVAIEIDVDADERVNVRKKSDEIHREVVKIVERQMGLKLIAKPLLKFQLMTEPLKLSKPEAEKASSTPKKGGVFGGYFSRGKSSETDETDVTPQKEDPSFPPVSLGSSEAPSSTILLSSLQDEDEKTDKG